MHSVLLMPYLVVLLKPRCETVREGHREANGKMDSGAFGDLLHSVVQWVRAGSQPIYFLWLRE